MIESQTAQQRRSSRVFTRIPVRATGKNTDGRKFRENSQTIVINAHGGLLYLHESLELGAQVVLINPVTEEEQECRVVYLGDMSDKGTRMTRRNCRRARRRRIAKRGRAEHFDFLRAYDRIDIALDTFPYNGGTTTMEALWQGVPVLAFDGDRWAARTSRSLLLAAGLQDWVMPNVESYVQHAITLATDPATPARWRFCARQCAIDCAQHRPVLRRPQHA